MNVIDPKFKVPKRRILSRTILPNLYNEKVNELKKELKS